MASTAFHTKVSQPCLAWTSLRSLVKKTEFQDSYDDSGLEGTIYGPALFLPEVFGHLLVQSWKD